MDQLELAAQPTPEYRTIPLTKGKTAIVDACDYDWLSQWKWCATENKYRGVYYAVRRSRKKRNERSHIVIMHREILGLDRGDRRQGDHENLDTLDNRRHNLRIATPSQQQCNRRKQSNNSSGFKGVSFNKKMGKWEAYLKIEKKRKHLGYFNTRELAYKAYCSSALENHKDFRRLE